MKLSRSIRKLLRLRKVSRQRPAFGRVQDELRARSKAFIAANSLETRTAAFTLLFRALWTGSNERAFTGRMICWIRLLESDDLLRMEFQQAFQFMVGDLNSLSLFAEAGLPAHHAIVREGLRRLVQRFLPSARAESDTSRLVVGLFASSREVDRFLNLPDNLFDRLRILLWPPKEIAAGSPPAAVRLESDIRQALRLIAARTSGRGLTSAIRERGSGARTEESPLYQLTFFTERLAAAGDAESNAASWKDWKACIGRCREEIELVYLHMEGSGASSDLMLDLRSIESALVRMSRLSDVIDPEASRSGEREPSADHVASSALRRLLNDLIEGRLEDKRLSSLLKQNLNLLARKTVEHTGHSGEHYIAHSNKEYWQMWLAAGGGGLLTVLTAAIKMSIVEHRFPLFIEGFLSGLNYAVSFVLLQVFGLVLATKQPSATAATFAGIVRRDRGVARWSKIADFTARITRTQLAAALGNIIAVCAGAVAFERLWNVMFSESYLPPESARHVYETLHPFRSGTIFYAAATGLILWLAALIGGWCENFADYHRIPAAIAQHPAGARIGARWMSRASIWIEVNLSGWSTSIALGFLLGFTPVIGRFFGIPIDVRHVTLTTGTLALAAARFGTSSFGHGWFYYAVGGIAITFVFNLGVSFFIAAFVALRAYNVSNREQLELLRFLFGEMRRSPLKFLIPVRAEKLPAHSLLGLNKEDAGSET